MHIVSGNKKRIKNRGFTYVGLLVVIVIIGITTSVVAQTWMSMARIQKEKELLWIGHQFRNAIKGYSEYRKAMHQEQGGPYYPSDLKDLLKDPGRPSDHAYIRKIYIDPMTGKDDWVVIRGGVQGGGTGIMGVHSASDIKPLKTDGFDEDDKSFTFKERYSEWEFTYPPRPGPYSGSPVSPAKKGKGTSKGGGTGGWGTGDW